MAETNQKLLNNSRLPHALTVVAGEAVGVGVGVGGLGAVGLGGEAVGVEGESADLEVCHRGGVLGAGVGVIIVGRRG